MTLFSIINWSQRFLSLCNVTTSIQWAVFFFTEWPPKQSLQGEFLMTVFCVSLLRDQKVTVFVSVQGDHLIAQCVYNSEGRSTITLGGLTTRQEMCLVFALYYPRIDMSLCHSLPSLPTVLHSLGIQELWPWVSKYALCNVKVFTYPNAVLKWFLYSCFLYDLLTVCIFRFFLSLKIAHISKA